MKFYVDSYHFKLLRDYERLAVFKEAIDEFAKDYSQNESDDSYSVAFDLGAGSGVLSSFACNHFDKVFSIERSPKTYDLAKRNLSHFDNVELFNEDVLDFDFSKIPKADLIICETLDTALIDEEEVPILNHARKFLKNEGKIIPQSIINSAEVIFMNPHYLQYEDDEYKPDHEILSRPVIFSQFDFMDEIDERFSTVIEFEIDNQLNGFELSDSVELEKSDSFKDSESDKTSNDNINGNEDKVKVNGIKLTSFTKLNENIICGPTPMLNPAMLVPFDEIEVKNGDKLRIELSYVMGGGVETIKTEILD